MITDEKRAELRAQRTQRKFERLHRAITREARAWTGPERVGWNTYVPNGDVVARACAETRAAYVVAHPIPMMPRRKRRNRQKSRRGAPTNGIVSEVECNSAYARGEGLCHTIRRAPRPTGRLSYTQAVQHGIVKE